MYWSLYSQGLKMVKSDFWLAEMIKNSATVCLRKNAFNWFWLADFKTKKAPPMFKIFDFILISHKSENQLDYRITTVQHKYWRVIILKTCKNQLFVKKLLIVDPNWTNLISGHLDSMMSYRASVTWSVCFEVHFPARVRFRAILWYNKKW